MLDEPIHTLLTDDEAAQLVETFLARYEAGLCPCCETPIEREAQYGRYVCVEPCGCWLGQGVARSEEELELCGEKRHNQHPQKEETTTMKQTPEEAGRATAWKSLALFLEGRAGLNWTIDAVEESGVRGDDLAKIIDDLRGRGSPELRHAIFATCCKKGWIDSPDESTPPLAMIIEDHEDAAVIFANALRGTGFEIEVIHSGDEALERLAETTPAVVILDLHLPRVSGAEILRQIRANMRLAEAYVIVATAYPDLAMGLDAKADQTFLKPVSFTQLQNLALRLGLKYAGGRGQPEIPVSG